MECGGVIVLSLSFQLLVLVVETVFVDALLYKDVGDWVGLVLDGNGFHQDIDFEGFGALDPCDHGRYLVSDVLLLLCMLLLGERGVDG